MFVQNKNIKEFCSNTWLANNDSFFHLEAAAGYLSYLDSRALATVQGSAVINVLLSLSHSGFIINICQLLCPLVTGGGDTGDSESVITSFYQIIIMKYKIHSTLMIIIVATNSYQGPGASQPHLWIPGASRSS